MVVGRVTITGLSELNSALNNFKSKIPTAGKRSIEMSMTQTESKVVSTVHVITGNLKSSIQRRMIGNEEGVLGASAEYAATEEGRGGTHRFMEPAYEQALKTWPEQYIKELEGALKSS